MTDTGGNLAVDEGKIDQKAMHEALEYMREKDQNLWAVYLEGICLSVQPCACACACLSASVLAYGFDREYVLH